MKIRSLANLIAEGAKIKKSERDEYAQITYGSIIDLCDHINKLQMKVDSQELKLEAKRMEESYYA